MKINDNSYTKLIKLGIVLSELGLVASLVLTAIIDFFFAVLESLDGGEAILEYVVCIIVVSLFYLIPQFVLYCGCEKLNKKETADSYELFALRDKAMQTSKWLFYLWLAALVISVVFMFVFSY